MADTPKPQRGVQILPPDRSLQQKIGTTNLEKILSPQVVQGAQQVIARSSDQFLAESVIEVAALEGVLPDLSLPDKARQALLDIDTHTFSLKSKAGLGGYDLVSILAKSLHKYCERFGDAKLTPANMAIIKWHIESMRRLLNLKVKGLGGAAGEAILAELGKLGLDAEPGGGAGD